MFPTTNRLAFNRHENQPGDPSDEEKPEIARLGSLLLPRVRVIRHIRNAPIMPLRITLTDTSKTGQSA